MNRDHYNNSGHHEGEEVEEKPSEKKILPVHSSVASMHPGHPIYTQHKHYMKSGAVDFTADANLVFDITPATQGQKPAEASFEMSKQDSLPEDVKQQISADKKFEVIGMWAQASNTLPQAVGIRLKNAELGGASYSTDSKGNKFLAIVPAGSPDSPSKVEMKHVINLIAQEDAMKKRNAILKHATEEDKVISIKAAERRVTEKGKNMIHFDLYPEPAGKKESAFVDSIRDKLGVDDGIVKMTKKQYNSYKAQFKEQTSAVNNVPDKLVFEAVPIDDNKNFHAVADKFAASAAKLRASDETAAAGELMAEKAVVMKHTPGQVHLTATIRGMHLVQ